MPRPRGFLEYEREVPARRPIPERINDWFEVYQPFADEKVRIQGARCMDCGIPFCHTGCPVNNLIPDWNDLVYNGRWEAAVRRLHATNNFPEFTGRICPAPCETACVLGIADPPVSIKLIEKAIVDRGFEEGWVSPEPPRTRTGKRVAIVGSGPAGLAAAQQLCRAGHWVTVFEKSDRIGGLLRYGIPNFKMEKHLIDRRLAQLSAEGVEFLTRRHVGADVTLSDLRRDYQAILFATGAEAPRVLNVPGVHLHGIHYAMEYLTQQNRVCEGDEVPGQITATGKRVAIIGGGDTGADCLGTAHRQHAVSIHQLEYKDSPPVGRHPSTPWPMWPIQLRVESSHEEGGYREWAREAVTRHPRRSQARAASHPGYGVHFGCRVSADCRGLLGPRTQGIGGRGGRGSRSQGQYRGGSGLHEHRPRHLQRGRRAKRPIAGGLGDFRRAQGGGRDSAVSGIAEHSR
jgi:glutamate synthase (NADPH/NADH) small chain